MTNIVFRIADALAGMIIDQEKVLDKKIAKANKRKAIVEKQIKLRTTQSEIEKLEQKLKDI